MVPPSPPWDENDLGDLDSLVDVKAVDEFLSLSPESLRLDNNEADEVITSLLTSDVDLDDLSNCSSASINLNDILDPLHIPENNDKNNNKSQEVIPRSTGSVGHCSVCALVFTSADLLNKHQADFEHKVLPEKIFSNKIATYF